jgi:hypothetical protein
MCGTAMELIRACNPGKVRCPQCGHEVDFLSDPAPPEDPHGETDGLLVIESFNGQEKHAALALRSGLKLTPAEALSLVHEEHPQIRWAWNCGLWRLFELKERLDAIGVSSRIERVEAAN